MPTVAAAGGGNGLVWVNDKSKTYHCEGTKYYGKTKSIVGGRKRKPVREYLLKQGRFAHFTEGDLAYFQAKGKLPESLADLTGNNPKTGSPYLGKVPLDPWGVPYQLRNPGSKSKDGYDVFSAGKDRQMGTDDDIGNCETLVVGCLRAEAMLGLLAGETGVAQAVTQVGRRDVEPRHPHVCPRPARPGRVGVLTVAFHHHDRRLQ